ncbi:MAG: aconitate hydratase [Planctomycetes bacterium]|nr:aconitate hydratase [Planctomycetota bacterium]
MGQSAVQKVLARHAESGSLEPGQELTIRIDQTLTQDATGTMAYLQLEAVGIDRVATELSVSYVDHNTVQDGFENADDHKYLQTVAARYGVLYSRPGNGICHQVHLERFARPGKTLLGSDSHTPTAGGIGMLAIGAGGLDVAMAMAAGRFTLTAPKVVRVNLVGRLSSWVSAKDVILALLKELTTKGNVGIVIEYAGPGVQTLSVPERATITNMGAELGVTTSLFPSDAVTCGFLAAQGRDDQWVELVADGDAEYDRTLEIDLSSVEPLAATPHSPGNVSTVAELAGMPVDQVCIGSCTNSSYADLMTAAAVLKGRTVHPNVSLVVAPGSRQVLQMIGASGGLATLIEAGARINECACGFCIGIGQAPRSDAVSLRTSNRNFLGRSGTKSANIYLVSPQAAAIAAVTGVITDPRVLGDAPRVTVPDRFTVDDRMVILPPQDGSTVEVYRGPNIGAPPHCEPLKDCIRGRATIKVGDKVTTDHIMPAGARMKYRSNIRKYSEFVFENVAPEFATQAAANRDNGIDNMIVAGLSYGQGSSREHAAICPMYLGVCLVAAKSIERIHRTNLINFGIVPAAFVDEVDYDRISGGDTLEVPDLRRRIADGKPLVMTNVTSGAEIELTCDLLDKEREILLAGGMLNYARNSR